MSGFERNFQEIEVWMQSSYREEDNVPLLLLFPPYVDQVLFFSKYMEYHRQIREGEPGNGPEFLIPIYSSLGGQYSKTSHALYMICNKLREIFDLPTRISLNENQLRKYFSSILHQANDKLKRSVVNTNNIILFFESINHNKHVSVKNWLPKRYPDRVKCIIGCEVGKEKDIMTRIDSKCIVISNPQYESSFFDIQSSIQLYSGSNQQYDSDTSDTKSEEQIYNRRIIENYKKMTSKKKHEQTFMSVYFGTLLCKEDGFNQVMNTR